MYLSWDIVIKNQLTLFFCQITLVKIKLWQKLGGGGGSAGICMILETGKSENRKAQNIF